MKSEIGKKYGKLSVVKLDHVGGTKGRRNAYWFCVCDCGLTTVVSGTYLRSGHTTSCGCVKRGFFGETHGFSDRERLYGVWEQMRSRCNNRNNKRYKNYGGNGIKVCEEWSDYAAFRKWAYENGYTPPTDKKSGRTISIDRIDPSGDYCPENCRWISISENNAHRGECHANQSGSSAAKR